MKAITCAVATAFIATAAATPSQAQHWGHRGGWGWGSAAAVGAGVVGGLALGAALSSPAYAYGPGYGYGPAYRYGWGSGPYAYASWGGYPDSGYRSTYWGAMPGWGYASGSWGGPAYRTSYWGESPTYYRTTRVRQSYAVAAPQGLRRASYGTRTSYGVRTRSAYVHSGFRRSQTMEVNAVRQGSARVMARGAGRGDTMGTGTTGMGGGHRGSFTTGSRVRQ